jgi:signal transduction histidine kinase
VTASGPVGTDDSPPIAPGTPDAATRPTDATTWAQCADRLGRLLPLPLLAVATLLSVVTAATGDPVSGRWTPGLVLVGIAAVWSIALTRYPVTGVPAQVRLLVVAVHVLLAGVLVWFDPWYGIFAFTGYVFADELAPRWRSAGFALTALVLAGSQNGGYPDGWTTHTLVYAVLAVFNMLAVLSMVHLTNRVMAQNTERGVMIAELGQANRLLEASMAENAGLHAQLLRQAREAGVIEERQRLAGEIHDTLAQGLTGIIAQLEAARQARAEPADLFRHLDLADSLARANLAEARRSVHDLRPGQLDGTSLPDALVELAQAWSRRSQVAAEVETTGSPCRTRPDVDAAVFRIAQEALTNVEKHARATRVHLTLSYLDDVLLLDVADDGIGFRAAASPPPTSYGLVGMRHRLALLSGTLTVESAPGLGTTVNAAIPLAAAPRPVPR